jgi:hypothetical protein
MVKIHLDSAFMHVLVGRTVVPSVVEDFQYDVCSLALAAVAVSWRRMTGRGNGICACLVTTSFAVLMKTMCCLLISVTLTGDLV